MRASLKYKEEFFVPEEPEHSVEYRRDIGDTIFGDDVYVDGTTLLVLETRCGSTRFGWGEWKEVEGGYIVGDRERPPRGAYGKFEGAYQALNAMVGVRFPECEVTDIISTLGNFRTLAAYEAARGATLQIREAVEKALRQLPEKERGDKDACDIAAFEAVVAWVNS